MEIKAITLIGIEIKVLKDILDSGDCEDMPIELREDGSWSGEEYNAFNRIRNKIGLGNLREGI